MFGVALFLLCALLALVALFAQGDPVPLTVTDRVKMWLDKLEEDGRERMDKIDKLTNVVNAIAMKVGVDIVPC